MHIGKVNVKLLCTFNFSLKNVAQEKLINLTFKSIVETANKKELPIFQIFSIPTCTYMLQYIHVNLFLFSPL